MAKAANMDDETLPLAGRLIPCSRPPISSCRAHHLVPVGKDNEAHVEITREIGAPGSTICMAKSFAFPTS